MWEGSGGSALFFLAERVLEIVGSFSKREEKTEVVRERRNGVCVLGKVN